MNFNQKTGQGHQKVRYYPENTLAKEFIDAFPCSRGQRKCLSQKQYDLLNKCKLLEQLGVLPKKDDLFFKKGDTEKTKLNVEENKYYGEPDPGY